MKKFICTVLMAALFVSASLAVPAAPYLVTVDQPDGTTISYYLRGDEHFSYKVSEDGYLLAYNSVGVLEYARVNADYAIVPVGVKASDVDDRTADERQYLLTAVRGEQLALQLSTARQYTRERINLTKSTSSSAPVVSPKKFPLDNTNGTPKSVVILVNFSDVKFTSPTARDDYSRLLNEVGYSENGGTGSARDYFIAASNGIFTPDFVVYGPYDLSKPYSAYGTPGNGNDDVDPQQMIIDACSAADGDINFQDFDLDGDKRIDNVFVYYAGYNEAEGAHENTIWPHRSTVNSPLFFDEVKPYDYACTSEFRSYTGGEMCGIGTFCHEFGHVLGLADLYNTHHKEESDHNTVGTWDIMDQGSYNDSGRTPPTYSSFERFYLGWLKPEILTPDSTYTLDPIVTSNKAYLVSPTGKHNLRGSDPDPVEFFMVENRQDTEEARDGVLAEGLLVTHIYFSSSKWNQNEPNDDPDRMGVQIVCAAGTTATPALNVFPGNNNVTKCKFTLRDETVLDNELSEITESGELISFMYGFDPFAPKLTLVGDTIPDMVTEFGREPSTQIIEFKGVNLDSTLNVSFAVNKSVTSPFRIREYKEDNSGKFGESLTLSPNKEDSTLNAKIELQFNPKKLSYDEYLTDKLIVTVGRGVIRLSLDMRGQSKVPMYITAPVMVDSSEVSPYSASLIWHPVDSASGYYVTVFNIDNTESSEVEQFSTFDKSVPDGWKANFNRISSQAMGSKPMAVYFTQAADTLWTKSFFMQPNKLSFWVQTSSSTGTLYVDAQAADGSWTNVHTMECDAKTRNLTVNVSLPEAIYSNFRIYYAPKSGTGGLAFDDFTTYYSSRITYVLQDELVAADTTYTVSGLSMETVYRAYVRARQHEVSLEDKLLYNYISDRSNEIEFKTIAGEPAESRAMTIVRGQDGQYRAYLPVVDEKSALFIYTIDGRLVTEIPSTSSEFIIPRLVNGQVYILKFAEIGKQKRKTKVGKLFYQE